jgi:hypothetical protein
MHSLKPLAVGFPPDEPSEPPRLYGAALLERLEQSLADQKERLLITAIVDCGIRNLAEAERALHAFVQWFAVLPSASSNQPVVMVKGPVDRMWHAIILHTSTYTQLCDRFLGYYLDHEPRLDFPRDTWVRATVEILVKAYGTHLSPLLVAWSPTTVAAWQRPPEG